MAVPIIKMANTVPFNVLLLLILLFVLANLGLSLRASDINALLEGKRYDFKDSMRQQLGGKFSIGINDPKSDTGEYPVRHTEVKPFYMDIYPVTNAQFWRYKMQKKKYRTSAEKTGYSWILANLVSESVKRKWASESVDPWWLAVKGSQWDRPEGPGTHVRNRLDYPVVHVSYQDAKAYCQWVGKRLPTEEEWEFAARGGIRGVQYPWGDKYKKLRMNIWQGKFPEEDKGLDGWAGPSPVDAFPAQNNNSMFDMLGNVWEWTATRYYERVVDRRLQDLKYVLKGGSYMDTRDGSANYVVRTANRMGHVPTYSAHNIGFRCAASAPHLVQQQRQKDPRYKKQQEQKTTTRRPPKLHKLEEMAFPNQRKNRTRRKDEL